MLYKDHMKNLISESGNTCIESGLGEFRVPLSFMLEKIYFPSSLPCQDKLAVLKVQFKIETVQFYQNSKVFEMKYISGTTTFGVWNDIFFFVKMFDLKILFNILFFFWLSVDISAQSPSEVQNLKTSKQHIHKNFFKNSHTKYQN